MQRKIKYPKLLLFSFTILIGAIIFSEGKNHQAFHDSLVGLGYLGTFLGGVFYAYGFTAAPATALLLVLSAEQNILAAVLIAVFGAVLSDFVIFSFVRSSFLDELRKLQEERLVKFIKKEEKLLFGRYYKHIFPVFAGFLIASPLPTEIGVTLMAGRKKLSAKKFLLIALLLHGMGILAILLIGSSLLN